MKRKRSRRARNPRLARRKGLADAFWNIVTVAALGGGAFVIYRSYGALSGSDNLSARLGAALR